MKKYIKLAGFLVFTLTIIFNVHVLNTQAQVPITTTTSCYQFPKDLQLGDAGKAIAELQKFLSSKGFAAKITAQFDQDTKNALIMYQTSAGLPATGYFGPLTRAKVNSANCDYHPTTTCPVGYTCTNFTKLTLSNPSATSALISGGQNGDSIGASVTFKFTLQNTGNSDAFISKVPSLALNTSTAGSVGSPATGSSTLTYVLASPDTYASDTGTAPTSGAYVVPAGLSRTFTYSGTLDNTNGTAGLRVFKITQINYGTSAANPKGQSITTGLESLIITQNLSSDNPKGAYPCSLVLNTHSYTLSPCNLNLEMTDGKGNVPFTAKILTAAENGYGFTKFGYGEGLPTYSVLGLSGGGAQGTETLEGLYLNDTVLNSDGLNPKYYNGHLKIHIFEGSARGDDNNFIYLNLAIKVNPAAPVSPGTPVIVGSDPARGSTTTPPVSSILITYPAKGEQHDTGPGDIVHVAWTAQNPANIDYYQITLGNTACGPCSLDVISKIPNLSTNTGQAMVSKDITLTEDLITRMSRDEGGVSIDKLKNNYTISVVGVLKVKQGNDYYVYDTSKPFTISSGQNVGGGLTISNTSAQSSLIAGGQNGDTTAAAVVFTFTLSNNTNSDVFISQYPAIALATSTVGSVGNPGGASSTLTYVLAHRETYPQDTGTVSVYGAFVIPAGVSRTFAYHGVLDNTNGTAGLRVFKITQINYGTSAANPKGQSITSGLNNLTVTASLATDKITPKATVTWPTGGQVYSIGGKMNVSWKVIPANIYPKVSVILRSVNAGNAVPADSGSQAQLVDNTGYLGGWTIGNIPVGSYIVRVVCNPFVACVMGDSAPITIVAATSTGIASTTPTPVTNPPVITAVTPKTINVGGRLIISGSGFTGVTTDTLFITNDSGAINPKIISSTDTQIVIEVPNIRNGTYNISLLAKNGQSNKMPFIVIPVNQTAAIINLILSFLR